jgi:hypothetical protein
VRVPDKPPKTRASYTINASPEQNVLFRALTLLVRNAERSRGLGLSSQSAVLAAVVNQFLLDFAPDIVQEVLDDETFQAVKALGIAAKHPRWLTAASGRKV